MLFDAGSFRLWAHQCRIAGAVCFTECVPTGNQRDRLFVVHRHAAERFTDILSRRDGIGLPVGPFGIYVNQAHLHGCERIRKITVTTVAFIGEPLAFWAPENIFLGLPHIRTPAAKTERLETHRLERDVARQNQQVRPGDLAAVFLFDRPKQPAGFVKVHVVRPTVEWREALLARSSTATAIANAIRPGAVPRHSNEQTTIMAKVRRPPILRVRHQGIQVLDHRLQVETLEFLRIVELLTHRIRQSGVLVKNAKIQLVRPPIPVRV